MAQKEIILQPTTLLLLQGLGDEDLPSQESQKFLQKVSDVTDPTKNLLLITVPKPEAIRLRYVYDPGEDEEEEDDDDDQTGSGYHESKDYDTEGDEANWAVEDMLRDIARERGLIP